MVVSPLWFVATYLALICLLPITVWLHRRYDALVLVVLAGLAVVVDILRFRYHVPGVEWANMLFVWGFAFQLGFFHGRISGVDSAPRYSDGRVDWEYQSPRPWQRGRMFALTGPVRADRSGLLRACTRARWSGSPGRGRTWRPPTVCIIALTVFQVGVAEIIRPSVLRALGRGGLVRQGDRRDHPVRPAAVPVPHHRDGAVPGGRVGDLRQRSRRPPRRR